MSKSLRLGSALSAIALVSTLGGCAASQNGPRSASIFGGKVDKSNIGLATRALSALTAKDYATAVSLAERAVGNSPRDAGYRSLLGTAYFASGRFASAEAAFRDSLSLISNQPSVVLKLALAQIAQGRNAEALSLLDSANGVLEAADYGLALALAGQPQLAVTVLEPAAREVGADARLRQNLALAHALSGDWSAARIVAAQDVPADQLDQRIQQWMSFAKPARASDQVAALTGVTPAASDPGQPTRLALHKAETRMAQAAPAPQPSRVVEAAPPPTTAPAPQFAPMAEQAVAFEPAPAPVAAPAPAPVEVAAAPPPAPEPAPISIAAAALAAPEAPSAYAAFAAREPAAAPVKKPRPVRASAPAQRAPLRTAALPRRSGKSTAVVQLGAYGSRDRVSVAWETITRRYPALRAYAPMTARFESARGTVYRLSIKGFDSQQEAIARCRLLRSRGGSCFVRNVAGDAPVQFASR